MPPVTDDYVPARLLSGRDRVGRIEKDAILADVLDGVASSSARATRWWWFALPAIAAAALVAFLIIPRKTEEFTAKGSGEAAASFAPSCGAQPCARGGKLLFDLHGTTGYAYFAAFARGSDGTVIWYTTERTLELKAGVLADAVVIGDEHAPGTYRVYGVFSHVPLGRDAIKALFDETGKVTAKDVAVLEKELVIR